MRQLTESRLRLLDLRAIREEEVRQLHSIMARQVRQAAAVCFVFEFQTCVLY